MVTASTMTEPGQRKLILVVDDQPDIRKLLRMTLECRADLNVIEAKDGNSAWLEAQLTKPELIVLDAMMPGLDGYEMCSRVRQTPDLRDTKVIICSARAQAEDIAKGRKVGCDANMTKPFRPIALLDMIDALLDRVH